jgi:zinc protease
MNRTPVTGLAAAMALALGATALAAQAPAVATRPTLGPAPRLVMPAVQKARLPNGLAIEVVPMHEVPLVQASLLIAGGARLDGSHPGLATFTANMLDEGAGSRDAFALAAEVAYLGATLNTGASWDAVTVDVGAPRRTFAAAMALAADVVLRPRFTAADIARQRGLRLASILQQRDQPGSVAGLVFNAMVFPAGHPYHSPLNGDSASTAALDSAGVRDFWRRAADPRRATLVVTGDVTLAEVRALAQRLFGGWKAPAMPLPAPGTPAEVPRPATRIILVDKPGAAQSVIAIGGPGVSRRSTDYPAITLMNTILGGSFSSRLNDILREQKGYTYGAGSGYSWRPLPGPFNASAQVRSNATDSSLAIFFREFRRIRDSGVTATELDRGRAYLVLGSLGDFETTGQVAGSLASLTILGLPLTTIPSDLAAIQKVAAADVQRAARTYLDPAHFTVVIVGDIAKIRPGIEALGLGPVEVRDYNGREVGG